MLKFFLKADLQALCHIHAMPVEAADLEAGAEAYASTLREIVGSPAVLDLVHLGLGSDGHTASLLPGDRALDVRDRPGTLAGPYQGRRRMTLTYPVINRARKVLFLVTGEGKEEALRGLLAADESIPAGRIRNRDVIVVTDIDTGGSGAR